MKEKEKDSSLYRSIAASHFTSKCRKHSKNCCKFNQEIRQIDINRYRTTFKQENSDLVNFAKEHIDKHGVESLNKN